jgi:hypothetical protein
VYVDQVNDLGTKMLQAAMTVTREGCRDERRGNGLYGRWWPERNVLLSRGPWKREGIVWGCLSVVNTATSAIFTDGAWVSGVDGSSSWSDLQRERKQ